MLHAELRGKVGPDASDGHRKEDVLTSTAFGTIFTAGDWDLDAIADAIRNHWVG